MFIGVDIGGTNLKAGIIDDQGNLIHQQSQPTNARRGVDYVITKIKKLMHEAIADYPSINGVGIGIPGIISSDGTVKIAPNLPGWENFSLKEEIQKEFDIPIWVDNDANMAAIAELEYGAGKNEENFLYATLGTGVGGAIIVNGKLFRGSNGGAGELGHIILDINEKLNKKKPFRTGILEEFVGRNQITSYARTELKKYPASLLLKYDRPDPYYISEAVYHNDLCAVNIFKRIGHYLGIGLATAMNILDINLVIIGGGISQANPLLLNTAEKTIKLRAIPTIAETAEIRKAHFTKDSGIIGAALMGKHAFEN